MLISKKGQLLLSLFFLIIFVPQELLWADLTSGAAPFFLDVNPGMGSNVSYLVIDDSSLGTAPVIFGWHYNGLTNPVTHTNWSGTDLLNGVISKLRGSPNQLSYSLGAYGLTVSYTFRGVTSITVDPLDSPVWSYWIKGGSEYVPYGDTGDFTFNAPATSWVISPNTSDTRWLTNGSFDGWTISPFSYLGAASDTTHYTDLKGGDEPVTFGTYTGQPPLSRALAFLSGPQTISFDPPATASFGQGPLLLAATASSGLAVAYSSSNTKVAKITGSQVTILGAGSTTITASQRGNTNWNAAPSVSRPLVVAKGSQSLTFAPDATRAFVAGKRFGLVATAASGRPVTFTSDHPNILAVYGSKAIMRGTGTVTVTASQAGNANWNAAAPVSRSIIIQ